MAVAAALEQRAYAQLHVKEISTSGGGRTITGIASTPKADRQNDEIVMDGVSFTNPLPLLLFHDTQRPVGTVTLGRPTADGLPFTAQLPDPATIESLALQERIREAVASVTAKLIRGVSIGFRPLNDAIESIRETGGLRFLETEILELSLVAIPANQDATIHAIKSFDTPIPAVAGTTENTPVLSGATAKRAGGMKTIAERKQAFVTEKAAKVAKLNEIIGTDDGTTLEADAQEAFDTLTSEIDAIDKHLARLETVEQVNKAVAVPVNGGTPAAAAASRAGQPVITVKDNLKPGVEFARYVMCLASAKGFTPQALEIAKSRYPDTQRIHTVLKAAVLAGTTTDATWAGSLVDYTNFAGDFLEFLRPQTILGKFGQNGIPDLRRVPRNVRIIGQTSGGDAYWVGEGQPKPLTKFDFTPTELGTAKVANIAVLTDELVRDSSPNAETLVRDALAAAIIARIDTDFINPNKAAVANVSPASITNGVTPIAASGATAAARTADIQSAFGAFIADNNTPVNGVWIMSATRALQLSMLENSLGQRIYPNLSMTGGSFAGLPVIVSQYTAVSGSPANDIVVLVNASDIYLADDGTVTIDASREASLQMDDAPTVSVAAGSPLAPVATSLVSMFQTNSVAIRAERGINWAKRRAEAVQYIENVAWTA